MCILAYVSSFLCIKNKEGLQSCQVTNLLDLLRRNQIEVLSACLIVSSFFPELPVLLLSISSFQSNQAHI